MGLLTYMYLCPEHGVFDARVEYEERDNPQPCEQCSALCPRTWQGAGPTILNHSFHDGARRFDNLRLNSKLMKEKAAAQASGDRAAVKRVEADIKRVNQKG